MTVKYHTHVDMILKKNHMKFLVKSWKSAEYSFSNFCNSHENVICKGLIFSQIYFGSFSMQSSVWSELCISLCLLSFLYQEDVVPVLSYSK